MASQTAGLFRRTSVAKIGSTSAQLVNRARRRHCHIRQKLREDLQKSTSVAVFRMTTFVTIDAVNLNEDFANV